MDVAIITTQENARLHLIIIVFFLLYLLNSTFVVLVIPVSLIVAISAVKYVVEMRDAATLAGANNVVHHSLKAAILTALLSVFERIVKPNLWNP